MKFYQHLSLLCLLFGICSCTQEDVSHIEHSQLIGHWDISVPSGLQFIEFISDSEVLIGDRGAIGEMNVSQHYYQKYNLSQINQIVDLPSGCKMTNLHFCNGRLTFDFINPSTNYEQSYFAYKKTNSDFDNQSSDKLNKTWVTIEENGQPIREELKKMAYFSKAGIYFLKDMFDDNLQMHSWTWNEAEDELCYTAYQRPTLIPQETCMDFLSLKEDRAIFEVDGNFIEMVPMIL